MKPSYHQINILRALGQMQERFICRHGYAFRVSDLQGNYLRCLSTPTVYAMQRAHLLRHEDYCPAHPEKNESWWITAAGVEACK